MGHKKKYKSELDLENKDNLFPIVIHTKTFKPPVRKNYVVRKILIDQLEKGKILPFTLVSAATGFGKSVTVSQWLSKYKHKICFKII